MNYSHISKYDFTHKTILFITYWTLVHFLNFILLTCVDYYTDSLHHIISLFNCSNSLYIYIISLIIKQSPNK